MASLDLRRILAGWEYEPNQITVRKVTGDDGSIKIQMRLDLGILQMEVSGRPDGQRPHGFESLLAYHENRLQKHVDKNGTELGIELTPDECQGLREEAVQYYHRYLAEFVLEDFAGVQRHDELRWQHAPSATPLDRILGGAAGLAPEEPVWEYLAPVRPHLKQRVGSQ